MVARSGDGNSANTIDGAQAEYLRVPNAQANLAKIPGELTDEQVVLLGRYCLHWYFRGRKRRSPDRRQRCYFCPRANRTLRNCRFKTERCESDYHCGFRSRANGDVETDGRRCGSGFQQIQCSRADQQFDKRRGCDVAIEALGTESTFENALRVLRPGGTLSSLGVYSGKLSVPLEPFAAGLGDHKIVTTLCPGGKERMRRLMELVRFGRLDLTPLLTHTFPLERIAEAYQVFGDRRGGVIKVAIKP